MYDDVLLATHGSDVATAVVREAPIPVLTVNRSVDASVDRIEDVLVATDGRTGGESAVVHAVDLAAALAASVHALSVVDDTETTPPSVVEAFEDRAESAVATVERLAAEPGVDATSSIGRGHPSREIVDFAADAGVDLLALGTER